MDPEEPLHILPLNLVAKITRPASHHQADFLQYIRQSKFGSIFGLIPLDLYTNCFNFCNLVPNFISAKIIELVTEDLYYQVINSDAIYEVLQCNFNMEDRTVSPKQI